MTNKTVVAGILAVACLATRLCHADDVLYRSNFEPVTECSYGPLGLTRALRGNVTYVPGFMTYVNADLTQYENIWGRSSPGDPPQPWPAVDNQIAYINPLMRDAYLSAQFTVPISPAHFSGTFKRADIAGDVTRTSASISESCGDFSTAVPAGCVINSGYRGSPLLVWAIGENLPPNVCRLVPGRSYFLNIMMAPLEDPTESYCGLTGCVMSGLGHLFN
ncbi:MAG: hypothetical protein WB784_06380 [Rhodanobacteraceae bacterium]